MFRVRYHEDVMDDDIPSLASSARVRIRKAIEKKLVTRPEDFGKPLRRSLAGYRSLRVGNFRVIFRVDGREVYILIIGHRRAVYKEAEKRLRKI